MTRDQFIQISEWQNKTFGQATAESKITHLLQEINELNNDLKSDNLNAPTEFADCFILLFGAAASYGLSYDQICICIEDKMQVNYTRKWGTPDENGVVNHIKD